MSNVFTLLLTREARLLFRRPAELANPLVFFAIVIALFPLAVGPETELLKTLSPGLLWVAALLAVLLSLDGLFRSDFEDGSLEQWVVSPHPLALLVLAKVLAHWLFSGLALDWVRDGLIAGGMLREVEVTEAMPKVRPWE